MVRDFIGVVSTTGGNLAESDGKETWSLTLALNLANAYGAGALLASASLTPSRMKDFLIVIMGLSKWGAGSPTLTLYRDGVAIYSTTTLNNNFTPSIFTYRDVSVSAASHIWTIKIDIAHTGHWGLMVISSDLEKSEGHGAVGGVGFDPPYTNATSGGSCDITFKVISDAYVYVWAINNSGGGYNLLIQRDGATINTIALGAASLTYIVYRDNGVSAAAHTYSTSCAGVQHFSMLAVVTNGGY